MEEHRAQPRHRILKAGTIEFGGEQIPCTVRNLSASGANVEINSPLWFPDRFVLAVPSEGWHKPCRVVWRMEKRIGLIFEGRRRISPVPFPFRAYSTKVSVHFAQIERNGMRCSGL